MSSGEIDVGLVVRVSPDVVRDRRVHVFPRPRQILGLAIDAIGECQRGNSEADVVLRASSLRRRRWRVFLDVLSNSNQGALPDGGVRSSRLSAQRVEFGGGHEDTRM